MFIRPKITRFKLAQLCRRLINVIHKEFLFEPARIQCWQACAAHDPVKCLQDLGKAISTELAIETLQDYTFDLKMTDNNKKKEAENGNI